MVNRNRKLTFLIQQNFETLNCSFQWDCLFMCMLHLSTDLNSKITDPETHCYTSYTFLSRFSHSIRFVRYDEFLVRYGTLFVRYDALFFTLYFIQNDTLLVWFFFRKFKRSLKQILGRKSTCLWDLLRQMFFACNSCE